MAIGGDKKMNRFIEFERHLEQQLVLERWAVDRCIRDIDIPDFTDHLIHHGFVANYEHIDLIYRGWDRDRS